GGGDRAEEQYLPVLRGRLARDRRGSIRAARQGSGQAQGDRDAAAQVRLSHIYQHMAGRPRRRSGEEQRRAQMEPQTSYATRSWRVPRGRTFLRLIRGSDRFGFWTGMARI